LQLRNAIADLCSMCYDNYVSIQGKRICIWKLSFPPLEMDRQIR